MLPGGLQNSDVGVASSIIIRTQIFQKHLMKECSLNQIRIQNVVEEHSLIQGFWKIWEAALRQREKKHSEGALPVLVRVEFTQQPATCRMHGMALTNPSYSTSPSPLNLQYLAWAVVIVKGASYPRHGALSTRGPAVFDSPLESQAFKKGPQRPQKQKDPTLWFNLRRISETTRFAGSLCLRGLLGRNQSATHRAPPPREVDVGTQSYRDSEPWQGEPAQTNRHYKGRLVAITVGS